jgi:hypothetical protein
MDECKGWGSGCRDDDIRRRCGAWVVVYGGELWWGHFPIAALNLTCRSLTFCDHRIVSKRTQQPIFVAVFLKTALKFAVYIKKDDRLTGKSLLVLQILLSASRFPMPCHEHRK